MLILGSFKVWVPLEGGDGVRLLLSPLPSDVDQRLVQQTTSRSYDDKGKLDIARDYSRYAQLVGRECVHDWQGVCDAQGSPVPFSAAALEQLMLIGPVQGLVLSEVGRLGLTRAKEVTAAGNASAGSSSGAAPAAPKR